MKTTVLVSGILAAVLITLQASAQHMNEKDSPCAAISQTAELTNCLSEARDKADAKLNSLYKEIRKRLEGDNAGDLIKTQRLWIQYRDANCSAERDCKMVVQQGALRISRVSNQ
jgi:uncharacterized protein YecT (DUF1311 family)